MPDGKYPSFNHNYKKQVNKSIEKKHSIKEGELFNQQIIEQEVKSSGSVQVGERIDNHMQKLADMYGLDKTEFKKKFLEGKIDTSISIDHNEKS